MLIVIRKVTSNGAWYKGMVGQTIEVEDDPTLFLGVERYKVKDAGRRTRFVRVDDAAPIRSGLVEFIGYHERMLETDKEGLRILKDKDQILLVSKFIQEKQEMLDIIKTMSPIFETIFKNTVEGLKQ